MTNPTDAVLISKREYLDDCMSGDPLLCCTYAAEDRFSPDHVQHAVQWNFPGW
jgi:hypothetical protein